ncbi:hypothetical protein V6N13_114112 [Hibiscus sabdariffa]|uniref:Uncharacterized protein n=1 Tax=Hibiscus sabdariffa TaxID=183260 RepID=A0ABR2U0U1_9ROSI
MEDLIFLVSTSIQIKCEDPGSGITRKSHCQFTRLNLLFPAPLSMISKASARRILLLLSYQPLQKEPPMSSTASDSPTPSTVLGPPPTP